MLDPYIQELIKYQERKGGIIVSQLKSGTKISVDTLYSTYEITVLDELNKVKLKGGKHFEEEVEKYFLGSTWGGSMLKQSWIGHDMKMEFSHGPGSVFATSRVQAAKVYGDGWFFEMDWD